MLTPLFLAIALLVVALSSCMDRILNGMKNAVFYAKGQAYKVPRLQPYIDNIHRLEAPRWYTSFIPIFVLLTIIGLQRGLAWYWAPAAAYLIAGGASTAASYWFQGFINLSAMLPWVDPKENPKAEFAITWPVDISFWWPRPWYGTRRRYLPFFGVFQILVGISLLLFL